MTIYETQMASGSTRYTLSPDHVPKPSAPIVYAWDDHAVYWPPSSLESVKINSLADALSQMLMDVGFFTGDQSA